MWPKKENIAIKKKNNNKTVLFLFNLPLNSA